MTVPEVEITAYVSRRADSAADDFLAHIPGQGLSALLVEIQNFRAAVIVTACPVVAQPFQDERRNSPLLLTSCRMVRHLRVDLIAST